MRRPLKTKAGEKLSSGKRVTADDILLRQSVTAFLTGLITEQLENLQKLLSKGSTCGNLSRRLGFSCKPSRAGQSGSAVMRARQSRLAGVPGFTAGRRR